MVMDPNFAENEHCLIHRMQKDGDWFIYLKCLAGENRKKKAHKHAQKSSKTLKPSINNFVSAGKDFAESWLYSAIWAVLGSQGIVVKCTAAIIFSYGGLTYSEQHTIAINTFQGSMHLSW